MSIQTEIDRINTSVAAAYAVMEGLGATMPASENVDNLAATAATIPVSAGGGQIYYAVCDTAAAISPKMVTVDDSFVLTEGAQVTIKFTNANTIDSPKLNVNSTGAKPIFCYGTTTVGTNSTTSGWPAGAIQTFTYDGTGWVRDYWYNTIYSNAALGQGYATCSTAAATLAKTASLSNYALVTGGIVAVKFTYDVPAGATLNINSKGAKAIYCRGAAITAGVIKAGDTATFIYSTYYHLISIDRDEVSSTNNNDIPDYVLSHSKTIADAILSDCQSGDSIVFPFLADAHCGWYLDPNNEATKLAGQLLEYIGKRAPFDFIVNGGDMATGAYNSTAATTYEQYGDYAELTADGRKGIPSIWVPGNHDDAPYRATADRITQSKTFAMIGSRNRPSGAICPNRCNYGYLDLDNRKLRVIYLDTDDKRDWGTVDIPDNSTAPDYLNAHNVGGVQLQWLADTALDFSDKTNPEEWGVVVVSHVALNVSGTLTDAVSGEALTHNTANAATILNAYKSGGSGSITINGVTASYDFTAVTNRAVVICAVHGHNHSFCSETLAGGIVSIGCPNVMNGRERVSDDGNTYTKTAGTANGTSFCIIVIDREAEKIYAKCVGVGYDREFQYAAEVIPYTNMLPISTDASGNIYNGKGWKENTYLSTGGVEGTRTGIYATGFIPCKVKDTLYCKNIDMQINQDNHRLYLYDASKNCLGGLKTTVVGYNWWIYDDNNTITGINIRTDANGTYNTTAFVRFCCSYLGEDSIVTVNEPIE